MLACVLFVQEWRIEFEMKREVGVVGLGVFRRWFKTQEKSRLVFYFVQKGE